MNWYADGSGYNGSESKFNVQQEGGYPNITRFTAYYTNNEMEYMAVISALKQANEGDRIYTDSQLVVNQTTLNKSNNFRLWKVNKGSEHLSKYRNEVIELLKSSKATLEYIPREKNKAGWVFE